MKKSDQKVAEKARRRGQATFTLIAQDQTAPATIAFWILLNIETAPSEKLQDALARCAEMLQCPNRKAAD